MGGEDDNLEEDTQEGTQEESKSSLKKAGLFLALFVFIIIIVMISIRSCSIKLKQSKDASQNSANEDTVGFDVNLETTEGISDETENSDVDTEKSAVSDTEKVVPSTEESVASESSEIASSTDESNSTELLEVGTPSLGSEEQTSVIVSGKQVYTLDNSSYVYTVSLIFPNGEDYEVVKYFCSKRTYDGVSQGETVNVTYQRDANGLISITTISK